MPTQAVPTQSRIRGFLFTAVTAATAGAVVGVLATTTVIGHGLGNVRAVTTVESHASSQYGSADAAEHSLTSDAHFCRPDAAQRWQIPDIDLAVLTADAAEKWLTPEIAVRDLPRSADAAEHWLCHAR